MEERHGTVLVVDDEPQNLHLLGEALREDHEIHVATSGREALQRAGTGTVPDLILLDVMMPGMDGWEVCGRLKSNPATADIPIIFITSRDDVSDETRGLGAGAVDYISKPFSPEVVRARVRTHLDLKRHMDKLAGLAAIDELTGLPNRRRFNRRLEEEWRRAARTGHPLTLVMMDVDHFKQYNDTYGHGRGDRCLRRVARALDGAVRRSADMVARFGGEEFTAILPFTNAPQGMMLGKRFCRAVQSLGLEHAASPVCSTVTISAGAATCYPGAGTASQILMEAADKMLYKAKEGGRNCVMGTSQPAPTSPHGSHG